MIKGCLILAVGLFVGWQVHGYKIRHDYPADREAFIDTCLSEEGEVLDMQTVIWCHPKLPDPKQ